MDNKNQTIELDCAPGGIRPGNLIKGVIEGTGLTLREPAHTFRELGLGLFRY